MSIVPILGPMTLTRSPYPEQMGLAVDKRGAVFSDCRTWRYVLWRIWDTSLPVIGFIGLNPSTADEEKDDPTIRRCLRFARDWGYGGIKMLNIFAYRATDPNDMKAADDPVGVQNDGQIVNALARCEKAICVWGVHGSYRARSKEVIEMLARFKIKTECLGVTKEGEPKHPLYLRADTKPIPFP